MTNDNNRHIDDDFLKNLLSHQKEESLPNDFTQKIMDELPKPAAQITETKKRFDFRTIAAIVIGVTGIVLIFAIFDVQSLFNLISTSSDQSPMNYQNIILKVGQSFSQGFSGFEFSSITIIILFSVVILFASDKILKNWFDQRVEVS